MFFCFNIVIKATQSSVAQCSLWIPHRLTTQNHVNGDGLLVAGRGRNKALVWARSQKYPRKAGKPLIWLGNSLSGSVLGGNLGQRARADCQWNSSTIGLALQIYSKDRPSKSTPFFAKLSKMHKDSTIHMKQIMHKS